MWKILDKLFHWFYLIEENRQKKLEEAEQISIDYYSSPSYLSLQEARRENEEVKEELRLLRNK